MSVATTMQAMVLEQPGRPLVRRRRPVPSPAPGQLLVAVEACGVCRTDLHVVDGELPDPALPLIPGHEIVGRVAAVGEGVNGWSVGDRVGIPWLASTCGRCAFCTAGRENLCETPLFTGYTVDGGYAEYVVADQRYCFALSASLEATAAAPLLCAGLIGYRAYRMAGEFTSLGIYGFGAAAHIVAQIAVAQGKRVYAFTRPGDEAGQEFARSLGCVWAGGSDVVPAEPLDAAIVFAPVGSLVPTALSAVARGGTVVCGGIHMSDIPSFPYALLWGERTVRSVANLTRRDGVELLALAAATAVRTAVTAFPLAEANEALAALREGRIVGAAVLVP